MGKVIIVGDTNCHYGAEYGDRCWGKTSGNAKKLEKIIKAHDMRMVDIDSNIYP